MRGQPIRRASSRRDRRPTRTEISEHPGEGRTTSPSECDRTGADVVPEPGRPLVIYTDSAYAIGVLSKGWKPTSPPIERVRDCLARAGHDSCTCAVIPASSLTSAPTNSPAKSRHADRVRSASDSVRSFGSAEARSGPPRHPVVNGPVRSAREASPRGRVDRPNRAPNAYGVPHEGVITSAKRRIRDYFGGRPEFRRDGTRDRARRSSSRATSPLTLFDEQEALAREPLRQRSEPRVHDGFLSSGAASRAKRRQPSASAQPALAGDASGMQ
jgi:hypothetical protein